LAQGPLWTPRAAATEETGMKTRRSFGFMGLLCRRALAAAVGLAALAAPAVASAVPGTLMHQGRLFDDGGAPVDATFDVTFSLYAQPADTEPLWEETHTITFEQGFFSVALGADKSLVDVLNGEVRYLGIKVGEDAEMTPRSAVQSVPYALIANDVTGDIHPASVSIPGFGLVIDENGQWVGDPTGAPRTHGAGRSRRPRGRGRSPRARTDPPARRAHKAPPVRRGPRGWQGRRARQGRPGPSGQRALKGRRARRVHRV
jgi:hypothetical protein